MSSKKTVANGLKMPRASPKYKGVIEKGAVAPDFSLWASDGKMRSLSEFKGKKIVLYFYPKDNTPGCTVEACAFREEFEKFGKKKAVILGISPDNFRSHADFSAKYSLPFLLFSDTDHSAAKAYGVWQNRGIFGWGVSRSTFIIDQKGKIKKVFTQVSPEGHAKEVLKSL